MMDTLAYVSRRNGAWLIQWTGTHAHDLPENEQFDCASSLAVAKRIAKKGARGIASHLRWVEAPEIGGWRLEGVEAEWNGWEDDETHL